MARRIRLDGVVQPYTDDVMRMQRVLLARGVYATPPELLDAWLQDSYLKAAGWLCLHDNDDDLASHLERLLVFDPPSDLE